MTNTVPGRYVEMKRKQFFKKFNLILFKRKWENCRVISFQKRFAKTKMFAKTIAKNDNDCFCEFFTQKG
jgi:hypothetical protein